MALTRGLRALTDKVRYAERCRSGRTGPIDNREGRKSFQGFESPPRSGTVCGKRGSAYERQKGGLNDAALPLGGQGSEAASFPGLGLRRPFIRVPVLLGTSTLVRAH